MMKKASWALTLLFILAAVALPSQSFARGRLRAGISFGYRGPAYVHFGYGPGFFPFHGYYGSHIWLGSAHANNGRVDFNVEPKESKIYVDGAYLGIADDFNGGFFGTTATLPPGPHDVRIVAPNGQVEERKIYVMPGKEIDLDFKF